MAFCGKCGAQVNDGEKFCTSCGATMGAAAQEQHNPQQNDLGSKLAGLNDTADSTADFDRNDIEQNKAMGILAYISWLVLIPLFAAKDSKFARFHANQGLVLAITEVAWWIITSVVSTVMWSISYRLGFVSTLLGLVNILFAIMTILGIMNAANGKAKELPVIGKFKIIK